MDLSKYKVVVWGADNYNTLGVLRSLGKTGLDVIMLVNGRRHGIATSSKYCKKYHISESVEAGVEFLMANYPETTQSNEKAVLIPGGDATSLATAKYYNKLYKRFHLMCTKNPDVLIRATDKIEMGLIAENAGLLIPKSQEYKVGITNITVPFPIILKPIHVVGRIEFKTKVIRNKSEFESFIKLLNPNNRYLIQQYIEKSHDIVIYGCRLPDGTLKLAGHHTLERWSDDGGGSYGHLSPEIPDYLQPDALKRFLDIVDYHGLFSAEYGYCNGKAYFYEVNFRNDGFCHLSFQAGANLPLIWVQACLDMPLTASDRMTKSGVAINEIYDVINAWRGVITWKQFRKDKKEALAFHFYDPEDILPYKNMRRRMWWEIPTRAVLKTFRPQIIWILNKIGH